MVIDSSAILAIAFQEPEARRMAEAIAREPRRQMSAVNWLETLIVAESRHGAEASDATQLLLRELDIEVVPLDLEHMHEALRAWQQFGKSRHPAGLNFSDCCAYASAIVAGEALLFKGSGFVQTDVAIAEW